MIHSLLYVMYSLWLISWSIWDWPLVKNFVLCGFPTVKMLVGITENKTNANNTSPGIALAEEFS